MPEVTLATECKELWGREVNRLAKSSLNETDRIEIDALHARRVLPTILVYIRFCDLLSWFSVSRLQEPASVYRAGKMHMSRRNDS